MSARRALGRVPRWLGLTTSASAPASVLGIATGLLLSWVVSVALGGTGSIAPHWFYLPIFVAGFRFGRRGAVLTAGVAVVFAGPLLPADTDTWATQPASDWVSRGMFFVGIGLVVAELFARLRHASEARFRVLVETSHDVVTVLDSDGRLISRDGPVAAVFGAAAATVEGRLDALLHPDDRGRFEAALERVRTGSSEGSTPGTETLTLRFADDGGWRYIESVLRDLRGEPAVAGLVLTSRDVSERQALLDELEYRATHDPLTGLANRTLFAARLDSALRQPSSDASPVGLLLVDLDRFKQMNDTYGHAAGDELLIQVADRLSSTVRSTDTVARLGGDEFAVLLPDVEDAAAALLVAQKLRAALEQPVQIVGAPRPVSASIGVATSVGSGSDSTALLHHADAAMYRAKQHGSGVAGHDPIRAPYLGAAAG